MPMATINEGTGGLTKLSLGFWYQPSTHERHPSHQIIEIKIIGKGLLF